MKEQRGSILLIILVLIVVVLMFCAGLFVFREKLGFVKLSNNSVVEVKDTVVTESVDQNTGDSRLNNWKNISFPNYGVMVKVPPTYQVVIGEGGDAEYDAYLYHSTARKDEYDGCVSNPPDTFGEVCHTYRDVTLDLAYNNKTDSLLFGSGQVDMSLQAELDQNEIVTERDYLRTVLGGFNSFIGIQENMEYGIWAEIDLGISDKVLTIYCGGARAKYLNICLQIMSTIKKTN